MIWELDKRPDYNAMERAAYYRKNGLNDDKDSPFKIGDVVEFWTGYNNDIRARAKVKAAKGPDLYVYNDCYWFPIQADAQRDIKKVN